MPPVRPPEMQFQRPQAPQFNAPPNLQNRPSMGPPQLPGPMPQGMRPPPGLTPFGMQAGFPNFPPGTQGHMHGGQQHQHASSHGQHQQERQQQRTRGVIPAVLDRVFQLKKDRAVELGVKEDMCKLSCQVYLLKSDRNTFFQKYICLKANLPATDCTRVDRLFLGYNGAPFGVLRGLGRFGGYLAST